MYQAKTNKQVVSMLSSGHNKTIPFSMMSGALMYELQKIQSSLQNAPMGTTRPLRLTCKDQSIYLAVNNVYDRHWDDSGVTVSYEVLHLPFGFGVESEWCGHETQKAVLREWGVWVGCFDNGVDAIRHAISLRGDNDD